MMNLSERFQHVLDAVAEQCDYIEDVASGDAYGPVNDKASLELKKVAVTVRSLVHEARMLDSARRTDDGLAD